MSNSASVSTLLAGLVATLAFSIAASAPPSKTSDISARGDLILDCGQMADISEMSLCLSKRLAEVKEETTASKNYGYPYRVAPTLPPFLRHDPPQSNGLAAYKPSRRIDQNAQRRVQGYSEPQYRNFLDLDSTIRPRVAEYRPVFNVFSDIPVILSPTSDSYGQRRDSYYPKPGKAISRSYSRSGKPRKEYGTSRYSPSRTEYQEEYSPNDDYDQPRNVKRNYKYNSAYGTDSQYSKRNSYDTEYFVPANSPIIGDIRRSLMDYTGARDLMVDEPDYLSGNGDRRIRIKEIEHDYYPFRRSDLRFKDLVHNERKRSKVT